MLPIIFIVGLMNIFSQHHNYGIKIEDPTFDIRVRRSIEDAGKSQDFSINNKVENYFKTDVLKREKRYAYYKKTRITDNNLYRYNNTQENNNNGSQSRNGNRYDIFNPNWNFLFDKKRNNSAINNGFNINNRTILRSYPYGYPPGYIPKTNSATASDDIPTSPGYRNQNNNNSSPHFYNYQNPDGKNFAGFAGYTVNTTGFNNLTHEFNNIPVPYASRYTPRPNNTGVNNYAPWNNPLAPYPPNYTENPTTNSTNNNNSGIHNLPYAPANGVYNTNFNSIPTPFNKDYLSPYAPNFNNGSATPNNTFVPYTPVNNTFVPYSSANNTFVNPSKVNSTVTTTEKTTIVTGCVICNIPCPQFMRRFGRFCVRDDADDDY